MDTETEVQLLRTIAKLIETLTYDTAVNVAQNSELIGWSGTLARLAGAEMRERIMNGRLDLMRATPEDIELCIAQCVAAATGKLSRSRMTAPKGGGPQAPNRESRQKN